MKVLAKRKKSPSVNKAIMDNIKVGRNKKDGKAKEKHERNGGYTQKHVRMMEAMVEMRAAVGKAADKPKSK